MNKVQKVTLAAGFGLAMAFTFYGCDESKPTNNNLVGVWELECANFTSDLALNMEFFNDGTGIADSTAIKWQLRDGNRLQIDGKNSQINDIELIEKGTLLAFHYDGKDFNGGKPRKAYYNKKGAKKDYAVATSTFTDTRDGKKYKTVKIGEQTWFAENLNYEAKGSKCNENKLENCEKYGRLYSYETAMKVCPTGWHLPTNLEWDKLYRYADGEYRCTDGTSDIKSPYESKIAGKFLKAKEGWNDNEGKPGNGTDRFGFTALPGGNYAGNNNAGYSYYDNGFGSIWWSASDEADLAYYRFINNDSEHAYWDYREFTHWWYDLKLFLFNVRCVQDLSSEKTKKTEEKVTKEVTEDKIFGKYPQGSTQLLTSADLQGISKSDLRIMRNEIFARHGYIFKSDDLKEHFKKQAWYTPTHPDVFSMLSDIELKNIEFIKSREEGIFEP